MRSILEDLAAATGRHVVTRLLRLKRPKILLACMPKSASSYLTAILAALPDMHVRSVSLAHSRREQEIDPVVAARRGWEKIVAQQHMRYSAETGELMAQLGLDPVVLVRDLPDVVVSLRDHMRNMNTEMSLAWITKDHAALSDERLDAMIVDLMMPWYIMFFVSWKTCPNAVWLHYRDVTKQPFEAVQKVCAGTRLNASEAEIRAAIDTANAKRTRFNVGQSGRGQGLSPDLLARLNTMASYYPDLDWSEVGLTGAR